MDAYIMLFLIFAVFIFIIYLLFDLARTNANSFQDKWTKKTRWMWLPFYAFWRLVREVILGKK